jgi:hypothetical protein
MADCTDVRRLLRLARIDGSTDLEVIATQVEVWCAAGELERSLKWPNRRTAKSVSGSWSYPNGRGAKSVTGKWSYPSGRVAKSVTGAWSYPSGRVAKSVAGRWNRPDGRGGTFEELLSWACTRIEASRCQEFLQEIQRLSDDDKDVAAIELAWLAREE